MRYLLDTSVWLWMLAEPDHLGANTVAVLEQPDTVLLLSAASSWEIAIKYSRGRLSLPEPPAVYVPDRMRRSGVESLPVQHSHALRVAQLNPHHRDPFDRLLVAQAQVESLPLLTGDAVFQGYELETIDATR